MVFPVAAAGAAYGAGLGLKALDEVLMEPAKGFSRWVWGTHKGNAQNAQQGAYQGGGAPAFQSQSSDPAQRLAMSLSVPQQQQGASYTPMAPTPTSSPGQIAMQQGLAQNAISEGSSTSPVAGPWGALARALQGTVGGYMAGQAGKADSNRQAALAQALSGGGDLGQMQAQVARFDPQMAAQIGLKRAEMAAQNQAKMNEPYTLNQGDVRFGAGGQKVAENPKTQDPFTLSPGSTRYGPDGKPIAAASDPNQPFNPDGTPNAAFQDYKFKERAAGKTSVNVNATGGTSTLTPANQTKQQDVVINTSDRLARLNEIDSSFKPEYLQIGTRAGMSWASVKDKFGQLDENDKKGLADFANFRPSTYDNLNQQVHDLSGTATSPAEAERILKGIPNPGTGLFDGDGPTEFQAKLKGTLRDVRMALARHQYYIAKGIPDTFSTPLDQVPALIDKTGAELEGQIKAANPGISDAELESQVHQQLKNMFGL